MRGVLICSVAGLVVVIIVNIWGVTEGLLDSSAWGSTIVLVLLVDLGCLFSVNRITSGSATASPKISRTIPSRPIAPSPPSDRSSRIFP